jgi:hypothetical protein
MLAAVRERALQLMDDLMSHPCTLPFHDPVDRTEPPPGYFNVIRSPENLANVRSRLQSGQFASIDDWYSSLEAVWQNAEIYYGKTSHYGIVAAFCRQLCSGMKKDVEEPSLKNWCSEVTRLRQKSLNLGGNPPGRVLGIAQTLPDYRRFPHEKQILVLSNQDLKDFELAASHVSDEGRMRDMLEIVRDCQPRLDCAGKEVWLDLTKLTVTTILVLREYLQGYFEEQGLRYPGNA